MWSLISQLAHRGMETVPYLERGALIYRGMKSWVKFEVIRESGGLIDNVLQNQYVAGVLDISKNFM